MSAVEELEQLLAETSAQELASANLDEIMELRKKLNPYGRTIAGSDNYLNFSITLIQEEYLKKLQVTAFVGFLFRMCDEWKVPAGVPVVPVRDHIEDPTKVEMPEKMRNGSDPKAVADYEFNKEWMHKRMIVHEFLEEFLQFNPDEHVRSAYRPNREDKKRAPVTTNAGVAAVEHLKNTDKEFAIKESAFEAGLDSKGRDNGQEFTYKKVRVRGKDGKVLYKDIKVPIGDLSAQNVDSSQKTDGGKDVGVSRTVREFIPPHDTFGRYTRYLKENYEELRKAVEDLYCEKPDYELAINPYSWHSTLDDAEAFKKKHAKEVIASVFTVHSGKWNFFDSFKKQRENVNFYTEDTIVLEEMIKQLERDEKLGRDLMKKRKTIAKKKNVIEDGPHAESFESWKKNNPHLQKLSMVGDKCDDEISGEDAIQVDVWHLAKGGVELTKSKFYTQAEAPLFAEEKTVENAKKNKN